MKKALLILPLLALSLGGCKDDFGIAAKAGADVATAIGQGFSLVGMLQRQGLIATTEAWNVANWLEFANLADKDYLNCVDAAHRNGNKADAFVACAQTLAQTLNDPKQREQLKIVNANAAQQISTYIEGIVSGVQTLEAALRS